MQARVGAHLVLLAVVAACSGGGTTGGGDFLLLGFMESGLENIPRNRSLTFLFSEAVLPTQDFAERLKIQNVPTGEGQSSFAKAIGAYVINADRVTFTPRLPTKADRSNAGFGGDARYVVFVKAGPDALVSATGSQVKVQQEFIFVTSVFFEDPIPGQPPRAVGFVALDPAGPHDLSRLAPLPGDLATMDNNDLIAAGRVIEPSPPGTPAGTSWQFDLMISETLDPQTITTKNIEMFEVYSDATTSGPNDANVVAPPGHFGTPVSFNVPLSVAIIQGVAADGTMETLIRVTVLGVLVDDTRYRVVFSGSILGIDFRKAFAGENGLTGDGLIVAEPGGLGYTTEFIVRDVPTVQGQRVLTFDPLVDGIQPETGQTTLDETLFNAAVYNAPTSPGVALGFVGAFGAGKDGNLAVGPGTTFTLDTGDEANELSEISVTVTDPDPTDIYKNTPGLPTPGSRTYDGLEPTEFDFETIAVGTSATLKIIGVNPCRMLCSGLVQIDGTIDASGGPGGPGSVAIAASQPPGAAGAAGPGGYPGGEGQSGKRGTQYCFSGCQNFDAWVNTAGGRPTAFPKSMKGEGPGRGNSGGEHVVVYQQDSASIGAPSGTGGGGASHADLGEFGEDRWSVGQGQGTIGKCSRWNIANSGLVGLRGAPGPLYGDREALDFFGGSGGAAGGAIQGFNAVNNSAIGSGGGGGGGGGFLEIISAGNISVTGFVKVTGGDGGRGFLLMNTQRGWTAVSGSGGGGSGGTLSLISGSAINLSGGMLDVRGGFGGARPSNSSYTGSCNGCNAGGDGGKGFIFLMDADGVIEGITPGPANVGEPGNHDAYEFGILSIRGFDPNRFGGVNAVTELYSVRVANPTYLALLTTDILATVSGGQVIKIKVSSANPDPDDPLLPDVTSETPLFEVAKVSTVGGGTVVEITGNMANLNPTGVPARDAFMRVVAEFIYDDPKEAALGPWMEIDQVTTTFTFN